MPLRSFAHVSAKAAHKRGPSCQDGCQDRHLRHPCHLQARLASLCFRRRRKLLSDRTAIVAQFEATGVCSFFKSLARRSRGQLTIVQSAGQAADAPCLRGREQALAGIVCRQICLSVTKHSLPCRKASVRLVTMLRHTLTDHWGCSSLLRAEKEMGSGAGIARRVLGLNFLYMFRQWSLASPARSKRKRRGNKL